MKKLQFSNGDIMPNLGLGTWKSTPGEVYEAIYEAVRIGYRHFDCAYVYGNEAEIGKAFADLFAAGTVQREELWITSKLWNNFHRREDVRPALEKTLSDLRLEYLDLYLIHWPVLFRPEVNWPEKGSDMLPLSEIPLAETWRAMVECRDEGLSRHIGVSNFSKTKIQGLIDETGVVPEVDQVELQPLLQQNDLKSFCDANGIWLTAYSPLGSRDRLPQFKAPDEPDLLEHPVVSGIAERNGISPAQVLIRWALQRGTAVIPKSVNPGRMQQNYDTLRMELSEEDMREIAAVDRHYRFLNGMVFEMEGSPYTARTLWDE
jgi:alcohol dehydrogenase (NADP+)